MRNGQVRIVYTDNGANPGADFTFGTLDTGYDLMGPVDVQKADLTTSDTPNPLEDGQRFGRDFGSGLTLSFAVNVDTVDATQRWSGNLNAVSQLARIWDARAVRTVPGKYARLYLQIAGRIRHVYGRPRRFAPANSRLAEQGHTPVLMDFTTVNDVFYGDRQSVRITRSNHVTGNAVTGRLTRKVKSGAGRTRAASLHIGGDRPTTPVITFHGAMTNPRVSIGNSFTVELAATLSASDTIVVDPRPWVRTVLKNGNRNVAGQLTRASTRLSNIELDNGNHNITFHSDAGETSAYVDVHWDDAYSWL